MEYSIKTLDIEIARIIQALRVIRSTPFKAIDIDNGFLPEMHDLEQHLRELRLAKIVLENTDVQEAYQEYKDKV